MAYTTVTEEKKKQTAATPAATAAATAEATGNGADSISAAKPVSTAEGTSAPAAAPAANTTAAPTTDYGDYKSLYDNAMTQLDAVKKNLPTYDASYDQALNDLFDQITNRSKFTYSATDDALYRQYKQQYTEQGRMAMRDTMGRAAALTGGYGSSYGQNVGQQAYHAYLQNLNDVIPELYGMAYQRYRDEGTALQNRYGMMQNLADDEYAKYNDRLNNYYKELSYWQGQADTAYNRQQYADQTAYDREQDAYTKQQDAYDRLVNMITTMGYTPNADDLAEAGMSDAHMQAYLNYFNSLHSSGGGGYSGGRRKKKTTGEDDNVVYGFESDEAYMIEERIYNSNMSNSSKVSAIENAATSGAITKNDAAKLINKVQYDLANKY